MWAKGCQYPKDRSLSKVTGAGYQKQSTQKMGKEWAMEMVREEVWALAKHI